MNVKILGPRYMVQQLEAESVTQSGIIIPDTAQEKPLQGKIVSVGTETNGFVKEGDVVLFDKGKGTTVKLEGQEYLILFENNLLAVI